MREENKEGKKGKVRKVQEKRRNEGKNEERR